MAVPSTGAISLGKIRQELQAANYTSGPYTAVSTSLDLAENGTYATINTCSPFYPLSANPANMSEWYGYDHDAPCPASEYALDDGGDSTIQNMLWDNGVYYNNEVSTDYPNALGTWSINVWVQVYSTSATQGYWFGLRDTLSGGDQLVIYHNGDVDSTGKPMIVCTINDGAGVGAGIGVVLNDTNNTSITGIGPAKAWSKLTSGNQGNTNSNDYTMITVVYDYGEISTDNFVKMYWNGSQLTAPWTTSTSTNTSQCYGDPSTDNRWSDTECMVGGFVPSELSSGLYIDELSFFYDKALSDGEISNLWNSGSVIPYNDITGSAGANTTSLLHYAFENEGNKGLDSGPNGYDLADYNSPALTSNHA